jgi:uncharacterized protein
MRIDLASAGEHQDFYFDDKFPVETTDGEEYDCEAEVAVTVVKTGDKVVVEVKVDCEIEAVCSRCLERFSERIQTGYSMIIKHSQSDMTGMEGLREEEREDVVFLEECEYSDYDILPRVREEVILALPMKLLCSQDCKGLCPICGMNLNKGSCDCERDEGDPRWAPLKKILSKGKQKEAKGE